MNHENKGKLTWPERRCRAVLQIAPAPPRRPRAQFWPWRERPGDPRSLPNQEGLLQGIKKVAMGKRSRRAFHDHDGGETISTPPQSPPGWPTQAHGQFTEVMPLRCRWDTVRISSHARFPYYFIYRKKSKDPYLTKTDLDYPLRLHLLYANDELLSYWLSVQIIFAKITYRGGYLFFFFHFIFLSLHLFSFLSSQKQSIISWKNIMPSDLTAGQLQNKHHKHYFTDTNH